MKFATKLTISVMLTGLIFVPLLGFTIFRLSRDILKEHIRDDQLVLTQHSMQEIDRALYDAYRNIQIIGEDAFLEQYFESGNSSQEMVIGTDSEKLLLEEVKEQLLLTGPWYSLMLVDKKGVVVVSTQMDNIGKTIREYAASRTAYYAALGGQVYYSDLVLSDEMGWPTVVFAAPIKSEKDGRVLGAVIGHFAWAAVLEILDEMESTGHSIYLFNKDGTVIATPTTKRDRILKHSLIKYDLVKRALRGERASSDILTLDEEELVLATCAPQNGLFGYKGNNWTLLIGTPLLKAYVPIKLMARRISLLVAILVVAIAAFLSFIAKRLVRPIETLTKKVQVIAQGDLTSRVEVTAKDEVGDLANAFNKMTEDLQKTTVSKDYVDNIIKSMNETLIVAAPEGTIQTVNQATLDLLGYIENELLNQPIGMLFEDEVFKNTWLTELIINSSISNVEKTYVSKGERKIPVLFSGSIMRGGDGKIQGIVCVAQDITERKRAEDKVLWQNALLGGINKVLREALTCETDEEVGRMCLAMAEELTNSKFGFIGELNSVGLFDTIAISNPGWDVCKMPGSEATKLTKNMKISGIDRSVLRDEKSRIVNDPASHPDRVGTPEGHPPITSFLGVPLKSGGKTIGMIGLANKEAGYDLADQQAVEALSLAFLEALNRKRAEEALKVNAERLEEMVDERTKELRDAQEQLVRREKLAVLGQLASGIGHELRNPLGVIGNSVYYLNMKLKDEDEKVEKHLGILEREVQRSNEIITDLLDYSRTKPPSRVESNVVDIVEDTLDGVEIPENIVVETSISTDLPIILLDPGQIRRLFLNFLTNAVGSMPEGGKLEIKAGMKNDFVEIMFRDTGEGISKENLQKIFEPLFTTKAKGIGLGLAIVKGIVDGHNGEIEVGSEIGAGTTFTVRLPLQGKEGV